MADHEKEASYKEQLQKLSIEEIDLLLILTGSFWEGGIGIRTLWQRHKSTDTESLLDSLLAKNIIEQLKTGSERAYRLIDYSFFSWLLSVQLRSDIVTLLQEKELERPFPIVKNTRYIRHKLRAGSTIDVGDTFKLGSPLPIAVDVRAVYTKQDEVLVTENWEKVQQSPEQYSVTLYLDHLLTNVKNLKPEEAVFIATATGVVGLINGLPIGEFAKTPQDVEKIKQTRDRLYQSKEFNQANVSDWVGKNIMMCCEASMVVLTLASYAGHNYHVAYVNVVPQNEQKREPENHVLNLLINEAEKRWVLVDVSLGVWVTLDGKRRAVPFVAVLDEAVVRELEKGKRVTLESMDTTRTYRIGKRETRPGEYEYNYLCVHDEYGKLRDTT